jgi:beta-phosphoglucomutase-like phosphatase (HAD superfamily)
MAKVKSLRDYRGALFDLDGTLVDSMWIWQHLCLDWLIEKGKTPGEDLRSVIETMTVTQSAEYVARRYGFDGSGDLSLSPAEIIAQWESMALGRYERAPLKAGMGDLVRELWESKVKLAVVSSCCPAACEAVLARHGLRPCFSGIYYTDEVNGNKSMPGIWLHAAEKLGVKAADCLVFEDLYQALPGVRAAGMDFAAVYDKSCADWEAMKAQADWVFGG